MNRLQTKYLGLTLKSPIVVSSSPYSSTLEHIIKAENAGAGAVVLKSIFEEQILAEIDNTASYSDYPEAADYLNAYITENSLATYISFIQQAKARVDIPIIASVNCNAGGEWIKFARVIEDAGADALELNIFHLPTDSNTTAQEIEKIYLDTVAAVRDAITIPLTVKLAQGFTNPMYIAKEIYFRNAAGVTLFNRFYSPDVDINNLAIHSSNVWSNPSEIHNVIRWVGMISSDVPMLDVASSTGVHSPEDVIKLMLTGAKAVQICSVIKEKGIGVIKEMNEFIIDWMRMNNKQTTSDFIGALSYKSIPEINGYERTQFMKYFSSNREY
ncbi:MAG: dihydroorotate dehydrogenase-like protein [Rikenellaceae bacterium]